MDTTKWGTEKPSAVLYNKGGRDASWMMWVKLGHKGSQNVEIIEHSRSRNSKDKKGNDKS